MIPPSLRGLPVATVDFEASCLPGEGSFPIEVAVAMSGGVTRTWLIAPTAEWLATGRWDPESEAIHGISRQVLGTEGVAPAVVCAALVDATRGHALVSDHGQADGTWMELLWKGAGLPEAAAPLVADLSEEFHNPAVLARMEAGQDWEAAMDEVSALAREARGGDEPAHRAGPDAEAVYRFIEALGRQAAVRPQASG